MHPKVNGHLRPNEAEVAAQVIDGEAILIHLVSGSYYSMDGVGGVVWGLLAAGHSMEAIADVLARRYVVSEARARADLDALAAELLAEGLVAVSAEGQIPAAVPDLGSEPLPYSPPRLNVYRDMADLLALDPQRPRPPGAAWRDEY